MGVEVAGMTGAHRLRRCFSALQDGSQGRRLSIVRSAACMAMFCWIRRIVRALWFDGLAMLTVMGGGFGVIVDGGGQCGFT